ncbi:hypothetical protein C8J56DRAFT_1095276 [Mycena floridula]|nr:hypothetical protein C8J56DRAFT_1095276 [Mycena floridula]
MSKRQRTDSSQIVDATPARDITAGVPFEIWIIIFRLARDPNAYPVRNQVPVSVSLVSRQFRRAALCDGHLWNQLVVQANDSQPHRQIMRVFVGRAKGLIDLRVVDFGDACRTMDIFYFIFVNATKVRSLAIEHAPIDVPALNFSFSKLEKLSYSGRTTELAKKVAQLSNITELVMHTLIQVPECISLLKRCPRLVSVSVAFDSDSQAPWYLDATQHIIHDTLQQLQIEYFDVIDVKEFLELITVPLLSQLTVHFAGDYYDKRQFAQDISVAALDVMLSRSGCNIQFFSLKGNWHYFDSEELKRLSRSSVFQNIVDLEFQWPWCQNVVLFELLEDEAAFPELQCLKVETRSNQTEELEKVLKSRKELRCVALSTPKYSDTQDQIWCLSDRGSLEESIEEISKKYDGRLQYEYVSDY